MNSAIFTKTNSNNINLFDLSSSILTVCHPLIPYFFYSEKNGYDLEKIRGNAVIMKNEEEFDPEEVEYYLRKYQYYKKYLFSKSSIEEIKFDQIRAEDVELQVSNINQVTFEVTESCNLRCKYCGYGEYYSHNARKNKTLNVDYAKALINYLINYFNSLQNNSHNKSITISFYGGEPLLNISFIKEIVEYINCQSVANCNFIFTMTTNGLYLKRHIDFLAHHNFRIIISLDGNKHNNSYRVYPNGDEAFCSIIENIKYVKESYPEYFQKYVNFNSVLHNRNSISDIYRYIKNEFGKIPSVSEVNESGIHPDKHDDFKKIYKNAQESLIQSEEYELLKDDMFIKLGETQGASIFIHQYSGNVYKNYNNLFENEDKIFSNRIPTGTCFPFSKKIFLTANGKILPCERIDHAFVLGNVTSKGVFLDFNKISKLYNKYFNIFIRQCKTCYNVKSCTKCIFRSNSLKKNTICEDYVDETGFVNYFGYYLTYLEENPNFYSRIMNTINYTI